MSDVVIYNLGGTQVLGRVSLRHAINMLHRRVAHVIDAVEGETFGPYAKPRAVELVRYIHSKWVYDRNRTVPYSKAALLRRDRHKCGYCGRAATTMDHVRPKSQGGNSSWENALAACEPCNSFKANRTPEQAGMRMLATPFVPTLHDIYPMGR